MRITQGTFSFLPDLTDEQIEAQIKYSLGNGWAISIEYTDDPHPRNAYWEMWGLPVFDLKPEELRDRPARGSRLPRGLPGALHQADRLRPDARPPDERAQLHRQPPAGREPASTSTGSEDPDRVDPLPAVPHAADDPPGGPAPAMPALMPTDRR